jgi:hypothetical protein
MLFNDEIFKQQIIRRLLNAYDCDAEIKYLVDTWYETFIANLFRCMAKAKLNRENLTSDWYKYQMPDIMLRTESIQVSNDWIDVFYNLINIPHDLDDRQFNHNTFVLEQLAQNVGDTPLKIRINLNHIGIDMTLDETLLLYNIMAYKRQQLQAGIENIVSDVLEIPFMTTLCHFFSVPQVNYSAKGLTEQGREVDFHLIDLTGNKYFCEFKLMGRGNPESADAVIARDSHIFVADKLSDLNKAQLSQRNIAWVELRTYNGYRKFLEILQQLHIPCVDFEGNVDERLDEIFETLFE